MVCGKALPERYRISLGVGVEGRSVTYRWSSSRRCDTKEAEAGLGSVSDRPGGDRRGTHSATRVEAVVGFRGLASSQHVRQIAASGDRLAGGPWHDVLEEQELVHKVSRTSGCGLVGHEGAPAPDVLREVLASRFGQGVPRARVRGVARQRVRLVYDGGQRALESRRGDAQLVGEAGGDRDAQWVRPVWSCERKVEGGLEAQRDENLQASETSRHCQPRCWTNRAQGQRGLTTRSIQFSHATPLSKFSGPGR